MLCACISFLLLLITHGRRLLLIIYYEFVFRAGIATGYGQDGPRIESRRRRDFPYPSRPTVGPTQPPIQRVPGPFLINKAAGKWH